MTKFNNICGAQYDGMLACAYLAHVSSTGRRPAIHKTIFMYGSYPCVRIGKRKVHIHRLVTAYLLDVPLGFRKYVHHINGDKRDARTVNLEVMDRVHPARLHNPKKKKGK